MQACAHPGDAPAARTASELRVCMCRPLPATHRNVRPETWANSEGKIKGGGTRRPWKHGLHRGWRGTQHFGPRAVACLATPSMLELQRAVCARIC
jgi:hypothetical protein